MIVRDSFYLLFLMLRLLLLPADASIIYGLLHTIVLAKRAYNIIFRSNHGPAGEGGVRTLRQRCLRHARPTQ
jgi:hypothetical protein